MEIERHEIGPRLSQTAVHGGTIYLAGQVAGKAAGLSVREQTADILEQIDQRLAAAGSDKTKILSSTVYLSDMSSFDEMNAVWDAWVVKGHTPPRACVETKLARPKYAVEIVLTAAR